MSPEIAQESSIIGERRLKAPVSVEFGDKVRVKIAPAAEAVGIAGRLGVVRGITTPSVMGIAVVGELTSDYAINVFFDDSGQEFWLAPELVEAVNHAPGTTAAIKGMPTTFTRNAAGEWTSKPRVLPPSEWAAWIRGLLRSLASNRDSK